MPSAARSESRIRAACGERLAPHPIAGTLYRVVENQEQIATRELVDGDLAEQALLEELLESTKPPRPPGTEDLDYLLATPWRYPPLRHGSRFGRRHEPGIFYGARQPPVALAECAYYRWVFLFDMATPPPRPLASRHTLYNARYRAEIGLRLHLPPFAEFAALLTHKSDYRETQALGSALREAGIEGFEYRSARDPGGGINVALFTPAALRSRRAQQPRPWLCSTTPEEIVFSQPESRQLIRFAIGDFLDQGLFPAPA